MSQPEPLLALAQARLGTQLTSKYRLDGLLGIGGMAAVYAATHRNAKRVAVKILHPLLSLHEPIRARFLREGYVANSVGHPGAVAVLDDDVADDGSAFLVMELLEGETLDDVHRRLGPELPPRVALAIGRAVLDVLAAAHAKGIVHRDIKPANLFLTRDGQVKVLDFGVARMREAAGSNPTHSGITLGTPAFMAPEQALGKADVDGRTDVWGVGATLFFLCSGKQVHGATSGQEALIWAATRPAPPLASVLPDAKSEVARVIDRALAFAPGDRWSSVAAMRDAIDALEAERIPPLALGGIAASSLPAVARASEGGASGARWLGEVADRATLSTPNGRVFAAAPPQPHRALHHAQHDLGRGSVAASGSGKITAADVQVRGTALAPIRPFILNNFGEQGWETFLAHLDPAPRALITQPTFSTSWYPYGTCCAFVDALVALGRGRQGLIREFAFHTLDFATSMVFRAIFKVGSPEFMVSRSDQVWRKLYSHGRMVCDVTSGRARVELHDFPVMSETYSDVVKYSIEAVLAKAGARVSRAEVTRSARDGDLISEFTYEWTLAQGAKSA